MGLIIDGKKIADGIIENIANEVKSLQEKPSIAVIIVGDNPASKIYVRNKAQMAHKVGFNSIVIEMSQNSSEKEVIEKIESFNKDNSVHAILVQLPLPKGISPFNVVNAIDPKKDVDGFHPDNMGKLAAGMIPYSKPATPKGIMTLLKKYNIEIQGKNAVIIGRSNIVGKPMSMMLLNENATVTICHSKTKNIQEIALNADILISAVGVPKMVKENWVKTDAVVIDVGINRGEDGKLCGDVDFNEVIEKASFVTPVPKGVGPMTIASLLENTLGLYKQQKGVK